MGSGWAGGHPGGWAGDGKKLVRAVSEVDTWYGHWLGGVVVQRHSLTLS